MEPLVFAAVLSAAMLHAGWNAVVKVGADRLLGITLVAVSGSVTALLAVPFVTPPPPAAWGWLGTSLLFHTGYKLFLAQAYRTGDLGQVYPIARGSAPLLVAVVMATAFGEALSPGAATGVGLLASGIWLMSLRGGRAQARPDLRSVAFALGTSLFIASYTITDGIGARTSGSPHGYTVWLFLFDGLIMLTILLAMRGREGLMAMRAHWRGGSAAGVMSVGAYWIVIWAMTLAPIALVATLRETSVLFAAAISVVVLKEPLTRWRTVSACIIVAGVILTRAG